MGMKVPANYRPIIASANFVSWVVHHFDYRESNSCRVKGGATLDHRGVAAEGLCPLKRGPLGVSARLQDQRLLHYQLFCAVLQNDLIHVPRAAILRA